MNIKPFKAIRPRPELVAEVASVPYDTVDTQEARELAGDNALSFLHVIRPEIDFGDDVDPRSPEVYRHAARTYRAMRDDGTLVAEDRSSLYLYRQRMGAHEQTGVVCCCHIDEYTSNRIRRHEDVRPEKLADRTALTDAMNAHTGPVFLAYRDRPAIDALAAEAARTAAPMFEFIADDGVQHTVWRVDGEHALAGELAAIPLSYVADGHHRAASAVELGRARARAAGSKGERESDWFLAVLFPAGQLNILPYNRCVRDLNGLSAADFLARLRRRFELVEGGDPEPRERGWATMYLDGTWYALHLPPREANGKTMLDCDLLQSRLLAPLLGIEDPRTDQRIRFIGGIRGTDDLERSVDAGRDAVAFSMYPVSMEEVMAVADAGKTMPPKSTWFEPKLRSGLLVHSLADR